MQLYGISNCGTVRKARAWLTENGVDMPFHDFKKLGVEEGRLKSWSKLVGWEQMLNRRGTTWRQIPDEARAAVCDEASAVRLMLEKPSVIKRPVLEMDGKIILG
ncbi:MAG: arsenate reductase, partial [Betaproteobacteria bacterium]